MTSRRKSFIRNIAGFLLVLLRFFIRSPRWCILESGHEVGTHLSLVFSFLQSAHTAPPLRAMRTSHHSAWGIIAEIYASVNPLDLISYIVYTSDIHLSLWLSLKK